ncbi:hypothetical protein D0Y65_049508 [Glycine soja]|uniref:Uncharacterized protein n=1 Tax=Glycine soja TaxID=3848 RepID=A0A445FXV1_GLYSO|nr:hypothetical protein D0Y65_049508 [Glycine soja]
MFGKFGSLDKIILPPTKTLALNVGVQQPRNWASRVITLESRASTMETMMSYLAEMIIQVVFLEPAEVKAAFRALAYKRYKDAPLYLEWAPSNILSQSSTSKSNEMNSGIDQNDVKQLKLEQNILRISDVYIDPDRVQVKKHWKNVSMGAMVMVRRVNPYPWK